MGGESGENVGKALYGDSKVMITLLLYLLGRCSEVMLVFCFLNCFSMIIQIRMLVFYERCDLLGI